MVYDLDSAKIAYKKAVGEDPSQGQLKMLLWQVIDPDSKVEVKRKGLDDPSVTYDKLCLELKDRLVTIAPQYA